MKLLISRVESQINAKMLPIILTVAISIPVLARAENLNRFEPTVFPVDAVVWLKDNPQSGRMFNAFDWGGYILLHLWPEQKVFIESQTDVRGELTREYEKVVTLSTGWQEVFALHEIAWVIVPPQWELAKELVNIQWEIAYQDQTAIILVRK